MANNRIFLVCKCGEKFLLAKYLPSTGWYAPPGYKGQYPPDEGPDTYSDRLNDFFDQHERSSCGSPTDRMWGTGVYHLEYEVPPDGQEV